jgi:hypothetical protein
MFPYMLILMEIFREEKFLMRQCVEHLCVYFIILCSVYVLVFFFNLCLFYYNDNLLLLKSRMCVRMRLTPSSLAGRC